MSAELEINAETGIANVFSVRETMWHRDGHVLTEAPDRATARRLAGHDFEVEVRPTYRQIIVGEMNGQPIHDFVESQNAKVTVRTDTNAELGAVGNQYTPLQNDEAFSVLDPLLDAGVAALETGGTLRGGADVWLQVKFDLEKFGQHARTVFGSEVIPFGLIANNHSGRRGCLMSLTPIRVVCANTLGAAETNSGAKMDAGDDAMSAGGRAIVIRHTPSVASKAVVAAEQLFQSIVERYEVIALQYKRLKETRLTEAEFRAAVLDLIAPDPRTDPRWNPEARMAESVVERAEKRRGELTRLWTEGAGHVGDHSAWEAYNAVTEALDHDEHGLWPVRSGVYRTQALLQGEYGKLKQKALNGLVALAG